MHAHLRIAQDGGNLRDGLIGRRIVNAHEQSRWKTTCDNLRSAVETPSGMRALDTAFRRADSLCQTTRQDQAVSACG